MTSAQSPKKDMPPLSLFLRVMLSNFSGVVRSMSTLFSSLQETISVSPVSSLHTTPIAPKAAIHSSFFSCTSALSGAMYIALSSPGLWLKAPVARSTCFISIWTIASSSSTVLPEPVGALTTNERAEERMKSSISAWMPLKYLKDGKMGWKHGGSSSTERTRSRESFGGEREGEGGGGPVGGAEEGGTGVARGRGARSGGGGPPLM